MPRWQVTDGQKFLNLNFKCRPHPISWARQPNNSAAPADPSALGAQVGEDEPQSHADAPVASGALREPPDSLLKLPAWPSKEEKVRVTFTCITRYGLNVDPACISMQCKPPMARGVASSERCKAPATANPLE